MRRHPPLPATSAAFVCVSYSAYGTIIYLFYFCQCHEQDQKCARGGKWTFNVPKVPSKSSLDTYWLHLVRAHRTLGLAGVWPPREPWLSAAETEPGANPAQLLAMIGEQFSEPSEICGAVVSVRAKGDRISLWTRTASNENVQARAAPPFRPSRSARCRNTCAGEHACDLWTALQVALGKQMKSFMDLGDQVSSLPALRLHCWADMTLPLSAAPPLLMRPAGGAAHRLHGARRRDQARPEGEGPLHGLAREGRCDKKRRATKKKRK